MAERSRTHAFRQLVDKGIEGCLIGISLRFDYGIDRPQSSKNPGTYDLPQPTLQTITRDSCMTVLRDDKPDTRMTQRGSENSDLEVLGPNTLPLSSCPLDVRTLREPVAPREGKSTTRQRT